MKKITIVWSITLLLIVGSLTLFGFKYKSVSDYKKLEKEMVKSAKQYNISKNLNKKSIELKELIEFDTNLNDYVVDDCNGLVELQKGIFSSYYKAKITCKSYKS